MLPIALDYASPSHRVKPLMEELRERLDGKVRWSFLEHALNTP